MQQKLAKSLADFNFFAFSEVRNGVLDDWNIVFVDYIIVVIACGKNDCTAYGDSDTNEGWCKGILIIRKG